MKSRLLAALTIASCGALGAAREVGPTGARLARPVCARAPPVVGGEPFAARPLHADHGLAVAGLAELADEV